jgi:Tol biopolymer transport system component
MLRSIRLHAAVLGLAIAAPVHPQEGGAVASHVTIMNLDGSSRREIYSAPRRIEAPNWSPDGKYLLWNSEGKLWKFSLAGGEPESVDTGTIRGINNDHGISPDGRWFAISAGQIYILPATGGVPRQITEKKPSYFHGWSPDGKWLAYCAERAGNFDLYRISKDGGAEERLTSNTGYDDGPDYSPDGKWIYFNSDRSGSWDIWRIPADGAGPEDARAERVTSDESEDWFPHPSPDGKWIVFLSFPRGTIGHPPNHRVMLRRIAAPGKNSAAGKILTIEKLFGGQGTMNVNSWSPDSKQFAFITYTLARGVAQ